MRADIFLSTRNKSQRLPGKALLEIKKKTVTEHLIDRLKTSHKIRKIILCTSDNSDDNILVKIAKKSKIGYFCGSEKDKLDRYLQASKKFGTEFIVIVDGDDMFCEPGFIDACVEEYRNTNADYISVKNAPVGTVPFCIKRQALEKVCNLKNQIDTEIFSSVFTDSGIFKVSIIDAKDLSLDSPDIRLTLDYSEDFELLEKIHESLYQENKIITLGEVISFLRKNKELLEINKNAQKKYEENQKKFPRVTLRLWFYCIFVQI